MKGYGWTPTMPGMQTTMSLPGGGTGVRVERPAAQAQMPREAFQTQTVPMEAQVRNGARPGAGAATGAPPAMTMTPGPSPFEDAANGGESGLADTPDPEMWGDTGNWSGPPVVPEPSKPKRNWGLIIVGSLVGAGVIGLLGYGIYQSTRK